MKLETKEWLAKLLETCEAELNGTGKVSDALKRSHRVKHLVTIQEIRRLLGLRDL